MAEGGIDEMPVVDGDIPLETIEEDLSKLFIQTVVDAGSKGTIIGPTEVLEDFALLISDKVGGKKILKELIWLENK